MVLWPEQSLENLPNMHNTCSAYFHSYTVRIFLTTLKDNTFPREIFAFSGVPLRDEWND
jgi:hypothetical protein